MGLWHVAAGGIFAIGWFVFFDGLALARMHGIEPYKFVQWLPGILCLLAMFMFAFVDAKAIQGGNDDDMFGSTDSSSVYKAKVIFFLAAFVALGALSIAVWQMSSTYTGSDTWPGVALALQCVALITCTGFLFVARYRKSTDDMM